MRSELLRCQVALRLELRRKIFSFREVRAVYMVWFYWSGVFAFELRLPLRHWPPLIFDHQLLLMIGVRWWRFECRLVWGLLHRDSLLALLLIIATTTKCCITSFRTTLRWEDSACSFMRRWNNAPAINEASSIEVWISHSACCWGGSILVVMQKQPLKQVPFLPSVKPYYFDWRLVSHQSRLFWR